MMVPPEKRGELIETVGNDNCIDFRIEHHGSLVRPQW
jgi:hypothetical protein